MDTLHGWFKAQWVVEINSHSYITVVVDSSKSDRKRRHLDVYFAFPPDVLIGCPTVVKIRCPSRRWKRHLPDVCTERKMDVSIGRTPIKSEFRQTYFIRFLLVTQIGWIFLGLQHRNAKVCLMVLRNSYGRYNISEVESLESSYLGFYTCEYDDYVLYCVQLLISFYYIFKVNYFRLYRDLSWLSKRSNSSFFLPLKT